jgi:hypothetical protein
VSGHVEASLSAFLDGELAPADRATVEAHLAECPACASHLAELAALDAAARAVPVEAPEDYFEAFPGRVRRTLEGRKARSWSPPHWGWAVAAAAILAVVTPLTLHEVGRSVPAPATAPAVAPSAAAPQRVPAAEPTSAPRDQVVGLENKSQVDEEAPLQASAAPKGRADSGAPGPAHLKQELADRAVPAATPAAPPPPPAPAPKAAFAAAPPPAASSETSASDDETGRAETDAVGETTARERRAARALGEAEGARPGAGVAGEVASAARPARLAEEAPASPRSAEEARRRREAWRRRAEAASDAQQADAAWVRVIELGAAAWRLGNDPDDLKALRQDAEAYLARPNARETERVRSLLSEAVPAE